MVDSLPASVLREIKVLNIASVVKGNEDVLVTAKWRVQTVSWLYGWQSYHLPEQIKGLLEMVLLRNHSITDYFRNLQKPSEGKLRHGPETQLV